MSALVFHWVVYKCWSLHFLSMAIDKLHDFRWSGNFVFNDEVGSLISFCLKKSTFSGLTICIKIVGEKDDFIVE